MGAIIWFHRQLQHASVVLTRGYITDGKQRTMEQGNMFFSLPMSLRCVGVGLPPASNVEAIAPSNQAILMDKVPSGFGSYAGHMYMRGAMLSDELRFGGLGGVIATIGGDINIRNRVALATAESGIPTYFSSSEEPVKYAIPTYYSKSEVDRDERLKGQIKSSVPVATMRYNSPTGRQTNRPSKRKRT